MREKSQRKALDREWTAGVNHSFSESCRPQSLNNIRQHSKDVVCKEKKETGGNGRRRYTKLFG